MNYHTYYQPSMVLTQIRGMNSYFHLDQRPLRLSQFKAQDEVKRRFYQALSTLRLVSEAIKLANIFQYSNVAEYKVRRLLGTILDNRDIKDLFILCEADHFLYSFMLPKFFAPYATRFSQFRDHVAEDLSDHTNFSNPWKRTMKTLPLSLNLGMLLDLLSQYATGERLPPNMVGILRSTCALGLESQI
jgi:hypothetical protein